jgi:hypothetical protein
MHSHPLLAAASVVAAGLAAVGGAVWAQVETPPQVGGWYGLAAAAVAGVAAVAGYLRARTAERAAAFSAARAAALQERSVTVDELQAVVEAQRGLNDLLRTANGQQAERIAALRTELDTARGETERLAARIHECEEHKATLNTKVELLSRDVNAIIQRDPTGPHPAVREGDDG